MAIHQTAMAEGRPQAEKEWMGCFVWGASMCMVNKTDAPIVVM